MAAKFISNVLRLLAALVWLGSLVWAAAIFSLEFLVWLKTGEWHEWRVADALIAADFAIPKTAWIGFERVIQRAMDMSLVITVPVCGFVLGFSTLWISKGLDKMFRRRHG